MHDMIDRQKVIVTREKTIMWLDSLKKDIGQPRYQALWHYAEVIDMAIEALSAEAVEVVRCKDCHFAQDDITHLYCDYFGHKVYEDDFCNHGERKGGDNE